MRHPHAIIVSLQPGQTQRLLVEAGSGVYVSQGRLRLNGPLVWLDGLSLPRTQWLDCEAFWPLDEGGWIDLFAIGDAQALVFPPGVSGLCR